MSKKPWVRLSSSSMTMSITQHGLFGWSVGFGRCHLPLHFTIGDRQ
ncbi:MAG TPA: hypothetical protein VF258_07110 [Luteolibacter sp.]